MLNDSNGFGLKLLVLLSLFSFQVNAQSLQDILGNGNDNEANERTTPRPQMNSNHRAPSNTLETHSVGVGIGQTFLKSDFGRAGEDKITWDLYYQYRASHSFDFIANFHTYKHKFGNTFTKTEGLALGIKGHVFKFDNFSPYILGGLGFYRPRMKRIVDDVAVTSKSKTTFGWHFGPGAELQLNRHFSAGVLLHIHNPFSIKQEDGPEVKGWYYKLMIMGMYTF